MILILFLGLFAFLWWMEKGSLESKQPKDSGCVISYRHPNKAIRHQEHVYEENLMGTGHPHRLIRREKRFYENEMKGMKPK